MSLQLVINPSYRLNLFPNVTFTESSEEKNSVEAIQFPREYKAHLQTLPEAAAFRLEAKGHERSDFHQATRSTALYFMDGGKAYVGFDHDQKSIVATRSKNGLQANDLGRELLIPARDLSDIFSRIPVFDLPESNLELSLKGEFSRHELIQALLEQVAQPYETYLQSEDFDKATLYLLHPEFIRRETKGDSVLIRPCHLGGDVFDNFSDINASINFTCPGFARGVIYHK